MPLGRPRKLPAKHSEWEQGLLGKCASAAADQVEDTQPSRISIDSRRRPFVLGTGRSQESDLVALMPSQRETTSFSSLPRGCIGDRGGLQSPTAIGELIIGREPTVDDSCRQKPRESRCGSDMTSSMVLTGAHGIPALSRSSEIASRLLLFVQAVTMASTCSMFSPLTFDVT